MYAYIETLTRGQKNSNIKAAPAAENKKKKKK